MEALILMLVAMAVQVAAVERLIQPPQEVQELQDKATLVGQDMAILLLMLVEAVALGQ